MDFSQPPGENYANPKTCFFHVLFKAGALAFYILSALFFDNFVSLSRMNKKDSWLFWWTLYLSAVAWIVLGIFSLIRFQADYLLVVGVCLTLSIANIVGFTKCRKDAKKQIQQFASQTIASRVSSTIQS
ncbi:Uncharacterized protein TCM_026796 isoform 2, partial [Theobroma cacao]